MKTGDLVRVRRPPVLGHRLAINTLGIIVDNLQSSIDNSYLTIYCIHPASELEEEGPRVHTMIREDLELVSESR